MKVGLGLYRHMLTPDNFRFAKQAGATHIVAHLMDYFANAESLSTASDANAFGVSSIGGNIWSYEELKDLGDAIRAEGLQLEAIENFDPSQWYDILLDGPRRKEQMEGIKTMIRNVGKAGIPIFGYYFSIAGVWGRSEHAAARGQARSVGFHRQMLDKQTPIPNGTVWNVIYDPHAPQGLVDPVSEEVVWQRLNDFLTELIPVAEEAGVTMAAHPDDPPLPSLRGADRLIYKPESFIRLLDIVQSPNNAIELCLGTMAEMAQGEMTVYEAVDRYSRMNKIGYIHFRNVKGKVPDYDEVFIDEGDVDMYQILRILHRNGFDGVLVPDHTPQMTCDAPWHAGMAYALGFIRAAIGLIESAA